MFCKTTKSKVDPQNAENLSNWIKKKWGPLIADQPGFKGYYFITKSDGEFVIIMLWEQEKNVQVWTENSGHRALVPEFMALTVSPVQMELYEVNDCRRLGPAA
jgi:heme-degrading monooxygenase HmoA